MTSEVNSLKTNELLHRRKLRLQQVREQSKDIAKKIRQRAKVETLRQVKSVGAKEEKEYLECQKQFINKLQELYTNGIQNIGTGHRNASEDFHQDVEKKIDKSKLRGKEAAAEVRRKKQEILNRKQELLDRKLQAREAANELSREKSSTIAKTLQTKTKEFDANNDNKELNVTLCEKNLTDTVTKVDMATQLNLNDPMCDAETEIPALVLHENNSNREPEKLDKSKRPNLFALSDEMPSSLRCGSTTNHQVNQTKPTLTLISEHIQNRKLRLREFDTKCTKKQTEDLQSIRQTIQRTRASKLEGSNFNNVCQVLDDQIVSVPTWKAEPKYQCCNQNNEKLIFPPINSRKFKSIINSSINNTNNTVRSLKIDLSQQNQACTYVPNNFFRTFRQSGNENDEENTIKTNTTEIVRKDPIIMYNHTSRNIRTLPSHNDGMVIRDQAVGENAFSKAQKEEINDDFKQKELQNKVKERRNKVALTKEHIDKEYRDTLAFLSSIPKDMSNKPIKEAFMNEERQRELKENRQWKLQNEYKNIEREHRRQKCKHVISNIQSRSKSPHDKHVDANHDSNDLQYSWMPVPERDEHLTIHHIPTSVKNSNTVKFSNENDYHEYRSGHKHTPPTKDIPSNRKASKKKYVEAVVIEQNDADSTECSSIASDSSSFEDLMLKKRSKRDDSSEEVHNKLSNADKIVIYKILNAKNNKKAKRVDKSKLVYKNNSAKSNQKFTGECLGNGDNNKTAQKLKRCENKESFEQLTEGIYKTVDNGDNMNTLQFRDNQSENNLLNPGNLTHHKNCNYSQANNQDVLPENIPCGGGTSERLPHKCNCMSYKKNPERQTIHYPSAATSTSSLRATINKDKTVLSEPDYIKLIDPTGQENGKFYVGTTGFLKDEAYEVIIQLRKKEINNKEEAKCKEKNDVETGLKNQDANNKPSPNSTVIPVHEEAEKNDIPKESEESTKVTDPVNLLKIPTPKGIDHQISSEADNQSPQSAISEIKSVGTNVRSEENVNQDVPHATNKKATSTYTQTSNSPIHRPVYMHMSSSTSTTYMSPPEIIMPRFLNRHYSLSCEDTHNSSIKEIRHAQNFERPKSCRCKHHYINKKELSHSINLLNNYKKSNHHSATPPNTASSALSDIYNKYESTPVSFEEEKLGACSKCRKHKKVNKKTDTHKGHETTTTLRNQNAPSKQVKKIKSNEANRNIKTSLNPVIKDYVNKLLELNKEGMKAVNIINEECSSVETPSSSIINDPLNMNAKISDRKISLEQIKNILKQKIINEIKINEKNISVQTSVDNQMHKRVKTHPKQLRRKQTHKVKSLNISKNVLKTRELKKKSYQISSSKLNSTSSSFRNDTSDQLTTSLPKVCSQKHSEPPLKNGIVVKRQNSSHNFVKEASNISLPSACVSATVPVSTDKVNHKDHDSIDHPLTHISTQTNSDCENNFMKVAENKLQNMEKIADLTEKCTKRLSNLAKVLEEVRKNKSLAYSQITSSECTSDSDSERNKNKAVENKLSSLVTFPEMQSTINRISPPSLTSGEEIARSASNEKTFIPLLSDIPKPMDFKTPSPPPVVPRPENMSKDRVSNIAFQKLTVENMQMKIRAKPPPALSRIHLKSEQDPIIPHELSTVLEVDSPMSLKLKSQSRNDVNDDSNHSSKSLEHLAYKRDYDSKTSSPILGKEYIDQDLVKLNNKPFKKNIQTLSSDTTNDSKLKMMDLQQFNEIMLKPFISIQEYAKKQYMETQEETSNSENILKGALITDDVSSFHSEGSLPDVIAELLKRNIISEPFKFDSPSNVNSSTISSESTISLLALSNLGKGQKNSGALFQSKKNVAETSDTLSISSNPDLENAFQKLGMGWASSTLKKTKERLALSSSSNTSSSSGVQLRNKIFNNQPAAADSNLLLTNGVKSPRLDTKSDEASKNDRKKAILSNTMTVKEFLTNELAKKITFTNKCNKNMSDPEFVSLYETKMPDEMKQFEADKSSDSTNNRTNNNNRARTSTPVQIFKSTTFQSSSSSNTSNGLFSNVDELSSVKVTSNSIRNHSTTDKDDLTIPNYILKVTKQTDCSKSD